MMQKQLHPVLKAIVSEASVALARLDADRLEEMALSCEALIGVPETSLTVLRLRECEAGNAHRNMAIFGRVLEETSANLHVMRRLHGSRAERLEYGPVSAGCDRSAEDENGIH